MGSLPNRFETELALIRTNRRLLSPGSDIQFESGSGTGIYQASLGPGLRLRRTDFCCVRCCVAIVGYLHPLFKLLNTATNICKLPLNMQIKPSLWLKIENCMSNKF